MSFYYRLVHFINVLFCFVCYHDRASFVVAIQQTYNMYALVASRVSSIASTAIDVNIVDYKNVFR